MFIKSAATDTCQGKAIQSINEKWGQGMTGNGRPWGGRETIGIQVCKKKFSPFVFTVDTIADDENIAKNSNASASSATGNRKRKIVKVVRMFGCPHHSDLRKEKIECYGVRKGWEPFGQWSLQKAQQLARRETIRLNSKNDKNDSGEGKQVASFSNGGDNIVSNGSSNRGNDNSVNEEIKTICHNGKCAWKMREKYDNVYNEVMGITDSSDEGSI